MYRLKEEITMSLSIYRNKTVKVIDANNKIYIGRVNLYTQPNDNDGEEAIALDTGIWLDESEIKSIEEVE